MYDNLVGTHGRIAGRQYRDDLAIDPDLDEDLAMIEVARELGEPVTALAGMPAHWVAAALTRLEWRRLEREKADEKAQAQGRIAKLRGKR